MTVRAELEELVTWISELQEPKPDETKAEHHLSPEEWRDIGEALGRAAKKFNEARDALRKMRGGAVLAELARDLEGEAEALKSRARVNARRVPETDPVAPKPTIAPRRARKAKDGGTGASSEGLAGLLRAAEESLETVYEDVGASLERSLADLLRSALDRLETAQETLAAPAERSAEKLLESAQGSIETAYEKLASPEPPDGSSAVSPDEFTKAFEADLDALAGMTLSLRQRERRVDDEGTV